MNSTAFLVPGLLGTLILVGVVMRATIPLLRRFLVPSCMIGGIVGFILMNTIEMPFSSEIFTSITYHLFNLSLISITLTSVKKEKKTEKHGSLMLWGGLWMALVFSMLMTAQGVIGGGTGALLSKIGFSDFLSEYGALATHGFAQGPGQGLAIGKSWEGFCVADASQIENMLISMMFVWGIIIASLVKLGIRAIKFDHLVDRNLQGSITGFVMDFLVVSAMMNISLSIILKYIVPLLIVSFVITLTTALLQGLLCYLHRLCHYSVLTHGY